MTKDRQENVPLQRLPKELRHQDGLFDARFQDWVLRVGDSGLSNDDQHQGNIEYYVRSRSRYISAFCVLYN